MIMNSKVTKPEQPSVRRTEGAPPPYLLPRVTIAETGDGFVLEAEMPGVSKDGLEILLENSELTLIGRRSMESNEAELIYRESVPRDFRRVFALDPTIDTTKIDAKINEGVLRLFLPKAERVKPRRIEVGD
jgi:HSP20 family protein